MKNFYKYIQVNQSFNYKDLIVVNAGHTKVLPNSAYPATNHPSHHNFNFHLGRVIDEYQIIYISEGYGVFESKSQKKIKINPGTIIFLFPGEWHRYKPDKKCGWTENWIGFKGDVTLLTNSSSLISIETPIIEIGLQDNILKTFYNIFDLVQADFTGAEYTISGAANYLLGLILTHRKRMSMKISTKTDEIIMKAKVRLEENYDSGISMEEIAEELNISYVWFRTYFKKHTGFSPYEYLLNIKINNAKILLQSTNYSVKEIATLSGFNSQYQFSKIFKLKTGKPPTEYKSL